MLNRCRQISGSGDQHVLERPLRIDRIGKGFGSDPSQLACLLDKKADGLDQKESVAVTFPLQPINDPFPLAGLAASQRLAWKTHSALWRSDSQHQCIIANRDGAEAERLPFAKPGSARSKAVERVSQERLGWLDLQGRDRSGFCQTHRTHIEDCAIDSYHRAKCQGESHRLRGWLD